MQYLLTEEEYTKLTNTQEKIDTIYKKELQELCTLAAEHIPVDLPWIKTEPQPWGCIINHTSMVCDECPAVYVCPYEEKEFSK